MIGYAKDRQTTETSRLRGGVGAAQVRRLLTPEDTDGRVGLCNLITLLPGSTIGEHPHITDGEIYLVTEGELVFTENGTEHLLHPGDVTYTHHGDTHAMANRSAAPAKLLAVVVQDKGM